jgi:formate dehydrogenase subunit delta
MANQIGKFFAPHEHETAVTGIANHFAKFWDPSMRKKIGAFPRSSARRWW